MMDRIVATPKMCVNAPTIRWDWNPVVNRWDGLLRLTGGNHTLNIRLTLKNPEEGHYGCGRN